MSEIFGIGIMGGGGKTDAFAAIGVTYPEGAICTCSYGTKTLTAKDTSGRALFLVPTAGQWLVKATSQTQEAEDTVSITTQGQVASVTLAFFSATIVCTFPVDCTSVTCTKDSTVLSAPSGSLSSGRYTFNVPEIGEWVLYCTNGVDSDTETVNVTEEKAYTVALGFALILFENGSYDPTTGGWTSITQNKLKLDHTDGNPYMESYKDLTTNNAVDLSGYNTLNFHVESAYNRYHVQVGTSNSKANNTSSMTAYKDIPENKQVTDETISVDISKISSAYIKLCVGSYNNMNCNITVDKVWAVK